MKKTTLWISISLTVLVVILTLSYLGYQGYKSYKTGRYTQLGDDALSSGNWNMSRFWYSKTLEINPRNIEILKRLSKNSDVYNDPDGVNWWKQWTELEADSNEAKFGYSEALLRQSQLEKAKEVIESIHPTTEEKSKYFNLQTAYFIAIKDFPKAEELARKAVDAEPNSVDLQLNLLNILLQKGDPSSKDEINRLLINVSKENENLPKVWRVLLGYSLGRKNWDESLQIAEKLANHPEARWQEKVAYLKLLVKVDPTKVPDYLKQLDHPPVIMIEEITRLLNQIGLSEPLLQWLNQMTQNGLGDNLSVQIAMADTFNALSKWDQLIEYSQNLNWGFFDYYRHLLLCRANLAIGNEIESKREWLIARKKASEAGVQEEGRMAQFVERWPEFEPQWIELLDEMLRDSVHVQWAYNKLESYYFAQGATEELFHLSQIARKGLPQDKGILNNYIMQGLLLKVDLSEMLILAKGLYDEFPGRPIPTSTYAFALYQNGDKQAAYQKIRSLDNRYFDIAEVAHYAAVIAKGAGDESAYLKFLEKSKNATLLPEEKALLGTY